MREMEGEQMLPAGQGTQGSKPRGKATVNWGEANQHPEGWFSTWAQSGCVEVCGGQGVQLEGLDPPANSSIPSAVHSGLSLQQSVPLQRKISLKAIPLGGNPFRQTNWVWKGLLLERIQRNQGV